MKIKTDLVCRLLSICPSLSNSVPSFPQIYLIITTAQVLLFLFAIIIITKFVDIVGDSRIS